MTSFPPVAVVLGGKGLLGQALTRVLEHQGWTAHSLGRDDGDVLDQAWLEERFAKFSPSAIFNTIAWTQVDDAEKHPEDAMRINRALPAMLARILKGSNIPLAHYSTDFVFNGRKDSPYTTEDQPDPINVYGKTKLAGEQALLESGLERCCIIRTAWLFGPGKRNFVNIILGAAQEGKPLKVIHDQTGSPTYTIDLAEASLALVKRGAEGVFHVVNGGRASWCELAAEAVSIANLQGNVQAIASSEWPWVAERPQNTALDTSRYTEVTGNVMRPWLPALRDYVFQDFLAPSAND